MIKSLISLGLLLSFSTQAENFYNCEVRMTANDWKGEAKTVTKEYKLSDQRFSDIAGLRVGRTSLYVNAKVTSDQKIQFMKKGSLARQYEINGDYSSTTFASEGMVGTIRCEQVYPEVAYYAMGTKELNFFLSDEEVTRPGSFGKICLMPTLCCFIGSAVRAIGEDEAANSGSYRKVKYSVAPDESYIESSVIVEDYSNCEKRTLFGGRCLEYAKKVDVGRVNRCREN